MLFKPSFKEGHYKYISNEYNHNPHSANWAPLFQSTQRLPAGILIIKQKRSSSSKVCLIVKCCKILVLQSCYAVIWYDCLRYEHDVDWAYLGVTDSSFICIMSHHLSHISSEQVIICVEKKNHTKAVVAWDSFTRPFIPTNICYLNVDVMNDDKRKRWKWEDMGQDVHY